MSIRSHYTILIDMDLHLFMIISRLIPISEIAGPKGLHIHKGLEQTCPQEKTEFITLQIVYRELISSHIC